jgi:hypothetical protein
MSQFDPAAFLDATLDAPLVKRPPLPVGDYVAVIGSPTTRTWVSPKDPTKSGVAVDLPLTIEVPAETQSALGLTQATISSKDGIMLDLTPSGGIDSTPGKNGKLRRYRDALDMNKPGDKFSFRQMEGKVLKVKIGHREYPEGSGDLFEEVVGIARA